MYNQIRYNHAVTVMMMSKTQNERRAEMMDELRTYVPGAELPENMFAFAWASNPTREAERLLKAGVAA